MQADIQAQRENLQRQTISAHKILYDDKSEKTEVGTGYFLQTDFLISVSKLLEIRSVIEGRGQMASIRSGDVKTARIALPEIGQTLVETSREGDRYSNIRVTNTVSVLADVANATLGECGFAFYSVKANRKKLGLRAIYDDMDAISQSAIDIALMFGGFDCRRFVREFNSVGLLVAERIEVSPTIRDKGVWKKLYFLTMAECLKYAAPLRPEFYYFKVFPLAFEGRVNDENIVDFLRATRNLKLLYAIHLNAKTMPSEGEFPDCLMSAPVPTAAELSRNAPVTL